MSNVLGVMSGIIAALQGAIGDVRDVIGASSPPKRGRCRGDPCACRHLRRIAPHHRTDAGVSRRARGADRRAGGRRLRAAVRSRRRCRGERRAAVGDPLQTALSAGLGGTRSAGAWARAACVSGLRGLAPAPLRRIRTSRGTRFGGCCVVPVKRRNHAARSRRQLEKGNSQQCSLKINPSTVSNPPTTQWRCSDRAQCS